MRIQCRAAGGLCGNQRLKPCVGWCVLLASAADCPLRGEADKGGARNEGTG